MTATKFRGQICRADLLAVSNLIGEQKAARVCGFSERKLAALVYSSGESLSSKVELDQVQSIGELVSELDTEKDSDLIWLPKSIKDLESNVDVAENREFSSRNPRWINAPIAIPKHSTLLRKSKLAVLLRNNSTQILDSRQLDVVGAVDSICRLKAITQPPMIKIKNWGTNVAFLSDRRSRLTPFFGDQVFCSNLIRNFIPKNGLTNVSVFGNPPIAVTTSGPRKGIPWRPQPQLQVLIVFSDFGRFGTDNRSSELDYWVHLGKMCVSQGVRCIGLFPSGSVGLPKEIADDWYIVRLQDPKSVSQFEAESNLETLKHFISPCVRLEPGLLRDLRKQIPNCDASTESLVWQSNLILSPHPHAATLNPEVANSYRDEFLKFPKRQLSKVYSIIKGWRRNSVSGRSLDQVWFEEVLPLFKFDDPDEIVNEQDLESTLSFFENLAHEFQTEMLDTNGEEVFWLRRLYSRLNAMTWQIQRIKDVLSYLWVNSKDDAQLQHPSPLFPKGVMRSAEKQVFRIGEDAACVYCVLDQEQLEKQFCFFQLDAPIVRIDLYDEYSQRKDTAWLGSDVGKRTSRIKRANTFSSVIVSTESKQISISSVHKPNWSKNTGTDQFGVWAELKLSAINRRPVFQRLRWIPGDNSFRGFWIFEIPVKTDVYHSLLKIEDSGSGESDDCPYLKNSFTACQMFVNALSELSGVSFSIPDSKQRKQAADYFRTIVHEEGVQFYENCFCKILEWLNESPLPKMRSVALLNAEPRVGLLQEESPELGFRCCTYDFNARI